MASRTLVTDSATRGSRRYTPGWLIRARECGALAERVAMCARDRPAAESGATRKEMRAILLTAIAAVILATPTLGDRAKAMTLTETSALRAAAADTALARPAVVVCGYNGC